MMRLSKPVVSGDMIDAELYMTETTSTTTTTTTIQNADGSTTVITNTVTTVTSSTTLGEKVTKVLSSWGGKR